MKVSEICRIIDHCHRLRDILLQNEHELTGLETKEICDLLWNYECELLDKEVK